MWAPQGPSGTPYEGGTFTVSVNVPQQYPLTPPQVKFVTKARRSAARQQTTLGGALTHAPSPRRRPRGVPRRARRADRQTASVMNAIKGMLAASCTVIRDGKEQRIDPVTLVPGDVVRLGLGDRVPADLRIIYTADLKTEQASLTGEPDAIPATTVAVHDLPVEARNLVFSSSLVMNGEGFGVVYRTGDNTMIGSIAALAGQANHEETLLQKEVHRFVNFIAILAIVCAFVFFGIGMGRHQPVVSTFVNGFIVVIVANVPEGLPATVTICLSITAKRMAERHVLIKRTDIIESLGSATVIASDKTGTLTQNRMTVEHLWYNRSSFNANTASRPDMLEAMRPAVSAAIARARTGSRRYSQDEGDEVNEAAFAALSGGPPSSRGGKVGAAANEETNSFTVSAFASFNRTSWDRFSPHAKLLTLAAVCNRARYEEGGVAAEDEGKMNQYGQKAERKVLGDASDTGLLRYCDSVFPVAIARANFAKQHEIPFNSVNKYAITVVADPGNAKQHICLMKGAPEIILTRCTEFMTAKGTRPIDDDFKEDWQAAYERFGSMGERVLGFAYKVIPAAKPEAYAADGALVPNTGLVFCGLISLVDPPRPGVAEAIATCRRAGIKVTMVTGDHPLTAEAIARKVGIITRPTRRDVAAELGVAETDLAWEDERIEAAVLTGAAVLELTQADWDAILSKRECVFARTSPQQKLKLVENYQRLGEVVAVTGDGVNDSPALKRAQIGVAMGSPSASDVAREAADIILLDDNFASIVGAIEEGRTLFDNLKKTIAYTLAHLWPELVPVFLNLAFSFPLGMNGLIILTIDLATEQYPAISLAYEKPEESLMDKKPRNVKTDRLVNAPSLWYSYIMAGLPNAAVSMWSFFMVYVSYGISVTALYGSNGGAISYWPIPTDKGVIAASSPPFVACGGSSSGTRFDSIGVALTTADNSVTSLTPWPTAIWAAYNSSNITWTPGAPYAASDLAQLGLPGVPNATGGIGNYSTVNDYIQARGCVFYTPQQQWHIYQESQSAWYTNLVMCQFFHVFNARTRSVSIFKHGLFSNVVTLQGVLVEVALVVGVVYIPAFHTPNAFQTTQMRGWFWLPHLAYGIYITLYNETIKWFVRNRPDSWVAKAGGW